MELRRHEETYETHDLELLAIVYALRVWRHYLIGGKFELKIDHSELLSEYEFEITYIKGNVNRVVDVLIRRPHIFSVIPLKTNLRENILTLQINDD
jgi:hypothetical protein